MHTQTKREKEREKETHINFNLQFAKVLEVLQQRLHGVEIRSFLVAFALCKTFYYHHPHSKFEWIECDAAPADLLLRDLACE